MSLASVQSCNSSPRIHGSQLILGEDEVFLSGFGFQSFEPFTKGFQIVAQPDAPHSGGRDEPAAPGEIVGHAYLAEGRLLQSDLDHRLFHLLFDPVLGQGLRRLISRNTSSPPFSYKSLKRGCPKSDVPPHARLGELAGLRNRASMWRSHPFSSVVVTC